MKRNRKKKLARKKPKLQSLLIQQSRKSKLSLNLRVFWRPTTEIKCWINSISGLFPRGLRILSPNKGVEEWVNEQLYEKKLFLVKVAGQTLPVSNQSCPLCEDGWNHCDTNEVAIHQNKLYHSSCLEKQLNTSQFSMLVDSNEIVKGLLT